MKEYAVLDEFLSKYQDSVHTSEKKLLKIIREAYPIGIPALIMKSSTDRLGASAGYSFHLGTPDSLLRRLASWLITKNNGNHRLLLKLNKNLWKRHGREDVALSAIIIANLDHASMETNPWEIFRSCLRKKEPIDYRRNGVITIFVGVGLFLLGYLALGRIVEGVGALVGLIGIGTMIAGYLYPNTGKELTDAVEKYEAE